MLQPVEQNHRRENSPAPLRPACDKWRPGLVAPIGDRLARADPSGQEKWPLNPESGADPQRGELIAERRHRRWQNRALPTLPLVIATPIVFSCRLSAPCSHRPELLPGCPPPRHQCDLARDPTHHRADTYLGALWQVPLPDHRWLRPARDRKSTRLNSSHVAISYAVFCLQKKKNYKSVLDRNEYEDN